MELTELRLAGKLEQYRRDEVISCLLPELDLPYLCSSLRKCGRSSVMAILKPVPKEVHSDTIPVNYVKLYDIMMTCTRDFQRIYFSVESEVDEF
jgi:hypothetical protein